MDERSALESKAGTVYVDSEREENQTKAIDVVKTEVNTYHATDLTTLINK
jgi:hypothetical protein